MPPITIIAEHGSHLLVRRERPVIRQEYAIIERRNGQVSGLSGSERPSFAEDEAGMAAAVGDGWMDEDGATLVPRDLRTRRPARPPNLVAK